MANLSRGKGFERNKSHILHTVAEMFMEKGYHRTTLREIANAANISYGSLINIFGTKEGLLTELVEYVVEYQFEFTRGLIGTEKSRDKIFVYSAETVLQLYLAESNENMREMYATSYSMPESASIIYRKVTSALMEAFRDHLPKSTASDFYELELAAAGIMRNYILAPCNMYFTMEDKVSIFAQHPAPLSHIRG